MKHITSILDIKKDDILDIFDIANDYSNLILKNGNILGGKIMGSFFLQPSTRTQLSFQSSFLRLGGKWIGFSDIETTRLGGTYHESFADTAKIVTEYCDVIVLRSQNEMVLNAFKKDVSVPVISAGCGRWEHPTQGLLDLFTIFNLLGRLNDINILISGNPDNRCVNSFLAGLTRWENINIHFVVPERLRFSGNHERVSPEFAAVHYYENYEEFFETPHVKGIDVIYIDDLNAEGESIARSYEIYPNLIFSKEKLKRFNKDVILLHPLPRTNIAAEINNLSNAKYFEQAKNGLYIRTALFYWLFAQKSF
ncbi:conserved hypothetical protein [Candidatus Desulfarcum epimagneticum]|uniref:Uncharacterized protein n=1 Tax=uncultured Desulfobacteraceae bacterium TaxID=218296 RepID=A0A484HFV8_9BACT|nr:conserved hypothetical protein [uncultured Desulfobacteraceae bacterium]